MQSPYVVRGVGEEPGGDKVSKYMCMAFPLVVPIAPYFGLSVVPHYHWQSNWNRVGILIYYNLFLKSYNIKNILWPHRFFMKSFPLSLIL
jgi:hypothetical protein